MLRPPNLRRALSTTGYRASLTTRDTTNHLKNSLGNSRFTLIHTKRAWARMVAGLNFWDTRWRRTSHVERRGGMGCCRSVHLLHTCCHAGVRSDEMVGRLDYVRDREVAKLESCSRYGTSGFRAAGDASRRQNPCSGCHFSCLQHHDKRVGSCCGGGLAKSPFARCIASPRRSLATALSPSYQQPRLSFFYTNSPTSSSTELISLPCSVL